MTSDQQQFPSLREWAATCEAIARGEQIVLIRKGGIAEGPDGFAVEALRFALLPTLFHQHGGEPPAGDITVSVVCQLVKATEVPGTANLTPLTPFHRYDPTQLATRMAYKPDRPLTLLAIQPMRLAQPRTFSTNVVRPICRSWQSLPIDGAGLETTPISPQPNMDQLLAVMATM